MRCDEVNVKQWGRFGMSTNKTKISFIPKMSDLSALITESTKEVSDIDFNINGILIALYRKKMLI